MATAFVADPSQQLAFGDGEMIRDLIDGAHILFSNEYEAALITQKTGWSAEEVLERVGTRVVTLGAEGVRIDRRGEESITVAAVPEIRKVEPTGVGDAFRAGFLAALSWDLDQERAAQLGCLLAVYVVEQVGTQEYTLARGAFLQRLEATYGADAVADISCTCTCRGPDPPASHTKRGPPTGWSGALVCLWSSATTQGIALGIAPLGMAVFGIAVFSVFSTFGMAEPFGIALAATAAEPLPSTRAKTALAASDLARMRIGVAPCSGGTLTIR